MITRLILSDGGFVYPNFLSEEERTALRDRMEKENLTMRCGCRMDREDLLYGISKDLKIYPLHNSYEHARWCSRAQQDTERNSSFVYDESGKSTVFLSFNPRNFSAPSAKQEEETDEDAEYVNEWDEMTTELPKGKKRKKELLPRSNLRQMIATLNHDTYSERLMNGKAAVLSEDYFTTAVLARCKRVYPSGSGKSLRALSLEEDRYYFIYGKVVGVENNGVYLKSSDGGSYRRFVPVNIMNSAANKFFTAYGATIDECLQAKHSVYVAGFAYKRLSREGKIYTCFGRLTFFIVTKNGIFANNMLEKETLEVVMSEAKKYGGVFLFPDSENVPYFGIMRITNQGKEGRIYLGKAPTDAGNEPVLCLSESPTEDDIRKFAEDICF